MTIGPLDSIRAATPSVARARPMRPEPATRAGDDHRPADDPRVMRVIELIKRISGREVRMVPPTAYFVSAPPSPHVESKPVEVVIAAEIPDDEEPSTEPIVVDVSAVLRDGASDRMILGKNGHGDLALFPGLNLEL